MKQLGCQPDEGGKRTPPFLEAPVDDPSQALVHLLPVPMEATVSYGRGTALGPEAILDASFQLELYDREFRCEPAILYGVHTLPSLALEGKEPEEALALIRDRVRDIYQPDRLLAVLGGEHTLTQAVVQGILEVDPGPLTVVQIDAHADLRDSYEDTPYSHACVSRRLLELDQVEQILQFGVRSICPEEAALIEGDPRIRTWFPEDMRDDAWRSELRHRTRGKRVYLTLDVDGLDPSLIPATGTPEPDGLTYLQTEQLIRTLADVADVLAFDCVELAPIEGLHAPDFVTAKLVYRTMNLFLADQITRLKGKT